MLITGNVFIIIYYVSGAMQKAEGSTEEKGLKRRGGHGLVHPFCPSRPSGDGRRTDSISAPYKLSRRVARYKGFSSLELALSGGGCCWQEFKKRERRRCRSHLEIMSNDGQSKTYI